MCGIFGILQHQATVPPSPALLQDTARRLQHRGPDGCGTHADVGIGLVHTRLSLVDLNERSNQPFWDASGRYCLVYNGELYDYAGLRDDLVQRGAQFRTTSDTEVLLEALIHLGVDATLSRIEGMFAFAWYDARKRELVVARDRFGMKPVFVHHSESAFVFASNVDAMRPWIALSPDALTVSSFLQGFNGPLSGRSFYEQVSILPPGAMVRVQMGGTPQFAQTLAMEDFVDEQMAVELEQVSLDALVDRFEEGLLKSVEAQLNADVPVGAFCSGGVDSSLIMAMAARFHGDLRVFHADIVGPLSERTAAEQLARHLKLDMQAVEVPDRHFVESLPDVTEHFGFPITNQTAVPLLSVSRLVQEHGIKAVLCGEGSDECYLGYAWLSPDVRATIRNLPGRIYRKLRGARPAGRGVTARDASLVKGIPNQFEFELGQSELGENVRATRKLAHRTRNLASDPELSYILHTLLHRNDTMGMAASIEARFPFLDTRLVKFSVNLPYAAKVRFAPFVLGGDHPFYRDKWIVRQVAARYLPPILSKRHKGAFPTNAFQRFRVDDAYFTSSFIAEWFELARPRLRYLLENASESLKVRLLMLDAWGHVCIRALPKVELSSRLAQHVRIADA